MFVWYISFRKQIKTGFLAGVKDGYMEVCQYIDMINITKKNILSQ